MKNTITLFLLVTAIVSIISLSFINVGENVGTRAPASLLAVDSKQMDINTISTWFRTNGSFNRDPATTNAGFEWPKTTGKHARYASGPWIGAKAGSDTLVAIAEYDYEYINGYTDNNGNPQGINDAAYRIYKIRFNQGGTDRDQWPNVLLGSGHSDQGAPVYYDPVSHTWKAYDYGDMTMFCRFTDSYTETHQILAGSTAPLKVDLKRIDYAFDRQDYLGNVIYSQYILINRRNAQLTNTYFTIWSDDDVGTATDDLVGCDTNSNIGFTYNGTNYDGVYGAAPPVVATIMLKGATVYTGSNNDTSAYCDGSAKHIKVGYKTLNMTVFNWYAVGQDPVNFRESYRLMSGLHKDGTPIINPITQHVTKYMYSGDPVTNNGWVQSGPNDQRFIMSTGPFTMNPGDTQVILIAQIIGRSSSNLTSISTVRQYSSLSIQTFRECFAGLLDGMSEKESTPLKYKLSQNYPNPFNPKTIINYELRITSYVRLTVYDVLGREVDILVNGKQGVGLHRIEWDGTNYPSGVYFYKLQTEAFSETKKMVLVK